MFFFFFNDTATTEIYTLSLHDALPIWALGALLLTVGALEAIGIAERFRPVHEGAGAIVPRSRSPPRSEEHTSELQSRSDLVCRLLLEKKKKSQNTQKLECDVEQPGKHT